MSKSIRFQFQRSGTFTGESELVQEFELSLTRPMGIHIEGKSFVLGPSRHSHFSIDYEFSLLTHTPNQLHCS